jgi:hypothetical protein
MHRFLRQTLGKPRYRNPSHKLAQGLGWFSIALGVSELLMPKLLSRNIGLAGRHDIVRSYGLREVANGMMILASRNPTPWIWTRAAGDAIDMATLLLGRLENRPRNKGPEIAMAAVAGVALADLICGALLSAQPRDRDEKIRKLIG